MYADDICLLAPTASAMQSILDVGYEYGTDNDILFNLIKSVCTVFKSKAYKLYIPTVFIGQEALKYISVSKYLGFSCSDSNYDDCVMLRQMRFLYAKSNKLIRTFSHCSIDVKITLLQSYCTHCIVPSCGLIIKNQHLQRFGSHSTMLIEKKLVSLREVVQVQCMQITISAPSRQCEKEYITMQRLENSTNTIICTLYQSWVVRFKIWNSRIDLLYIPL